MSLAIVDTQDRPQHIAVIGTGISGMAAAWLLAQRHRVTVYEKDDRLGGHTNTVELDLGEGKTCVDTGFIVFNQNTYPNLVALFDYLGVKTRATDMSFSASLDDGGFEYSGSGLSGLLAQTRNIFNPRMWALVHDLVRFYRDAPAAQGSPEYAKLTLGQFLRLHGYRDAFIRDHLLPMGAAIWSTPTNDMLNYPLISFLRFCQNHRLLSLGARPIWRTVIGGSHEYLRKLTASYREQVLLNTAVRSIRRLPDRVLIEDRQGTVRNYDQVVIAAHADQALQLLADADIGERRLLGKFRYERNLALLHSDSKLMPRSRRAWSSWNFMSKGRGDEQKVSVTYWMNRLQHLPKEHPLFVSLNPLQQPESGRIFRSFMYEHPVFDNEAIQAQRMLWNLQGTKRTWYCGAYFGHGFHEDGLQAGLAVAEQLGSVSRPWKLANPNDRIHCNPLSDSSKAKDRAA